MLDMKVEVLRLLGKKPMSSNQLAEELGIKRTSPVSQAWTALGAMLSLLRFEEKIIDLAIDRKAPKKDIGVVGADTYVYYRKNQTDRLVREGKLSEPQKVRGMDLMAQAASLGVGRFDDDDLDRLDAIGRANYLSDSEK